MAGQVKAKIVIAQAGNPPPGGYTSGGRDNLTLGNQITATNYDDANVTSWSWKLVVPVFQTATAYGQTGQNSSSTTFTPPATTGYGDCYLELTVTGAPIAGKPNVATDRVILGVRAPASAYAPGIPIVHPYESTIAGGKTVTLDAANGREGRVQEALYAIFRQALTGSSGGVAVAGSGFLHATGGLLDSSASHGADGQVPLGGATDITWGKVTSGHVDGSIVITTDDRLPPVPGVVGRVLTDSGSAWVATAPGAANTVLQGGGAGVEPSFTATPNVSSLTAQSTITTPVLILGTAGVPSIGTIRLPSGAAAVWHDATGAGADRQLYTANSASGASFGDNSIATALAGSTITIGNGATPVALEGSLQITPLSTGILHADASGHITSSAVVNADVATNAAIAVSKLAPAGGTHQILQGDPAGNYFTSLPTVDGLTATTDIVSPYFATANSGVASVGALRGANATTLVAATTSGGADLAVLATDASNNVHLGASGAAGVLADAPFAAPSFAGNGTPVTWPVFTHAVGGDTPGSVSLGTVTKREILFTGAMPGDLTYTLAGLVEGATYEITRDTTGASLLYVQAESGGVGTGNKLWIPEAWATGGSVTVKYVNGKLRYAGGNGVAFRLEYPLTLSASGTTNLFKMPKGTKVRMAGYRITTLESLTGTGGDGSTGSKLTLGESATPSANDLVADTSNINLAVNQDVENTGSSLTNGGSFDYYAADYTLTATASVPSGGTIAYTTHAVVNIRFDVELCQ